MSAPTYQPVAEPRKGARKHLTFAEMRALTSAAECQGLYEQLLVRLLYEVALRAGEVGQLRLDHCKRLHLDSPQIYLPRGKGSTTGWSTCSVELASLVSSWVSAHHGADMRTLSHTDPARYLFPGTRRRGKARGIHRSAVWNVIKQLCSLAGIDEAVSHPHALRHARATHLFQEAEEQGLDARAALKTVSKLLGHRSAQTSWEHYVSETGRGREIANAAFRRATEEEPHND